MEKSAGSSALSWIIGASVVALAFAAGMWLAARQHAPATAVEGLLWPDPPALQAFALQDHTGRPFDLERLRGRWSLLFFGFTHCPDVCPSALAAMAAAEAELRALHPFGERGQLVFVSVDPARDTPQTLASYVTHFSPTLIGATGEEQALQRLTRALGVLFVQVPLGNGGYSVDHSAGIFFVSPDLHLVSVLTPPQSAADIVRRFSAVSAFIEDRG